MVNVATSSKMRQSILAAATKVFDAQGYSAATVDEVAAEAGISKGSIYNYFKSKQDLFTQVFTEAIAVDEADVEELAGRQASANEKIRQLLELWYARLGQYQRIGALMLEFWATAARRGNRGELNQTLSQMYARWRGRVTRIVAQGVESGEFRSEIDPQVAASLIIGALDGLLVQSIMEVGLVIDSEFMERFRAGLMAAMLVGGDTSEDIRNE